MDNAKLERMGISENDLISYAEHSETGAGELFIRLNQDRYLAEKLPGRTSSRNIWHRYNGQYWEQDILDDVLNSLRSMRNVFYDEIDRLRRSAERDDRSTKAKIELYERAAARFDRRSFVSNAALIAAEGSDTLAFNGELFDKKKNKIPCANGLLDPCKCSIDESGDIMLEGKTAFRDMRPDDYVRYVCTPFVREARCPEWERFLIDALDGNTEDGKEVIDFLQVLAGYSLLGDPRQDVLIVKDSPNGRSGKGVFDKCLLRAAGNLGTTSKSSLFLKKVGNDPNKPEPALMALKDKRIVIMSEQGKGEVYDAAEVKTKTSGRDAVSARGLYGEETNFMPTYVFWQSTNDLPRVSADDGAFWARLIRIKFPFHFCAAPDPSDPSQKQIDTGLEERLEAETSGILNWIIKGSIRYIQNGYKLPTYPKLVREAINEYRQHEDSLADFLSDCCTTSPRDEVKPAKLFERYKTWCDETGKRPSSQKTFLDAIRRRRYEVVHTKTGNLIHGIGLLSE